MQKYYFTFSLGHISIVCDSILVRKALPFYVPEPFNVHGVLRFPRAEYAYNDTLMPQVKFKHPIPMEKVGVDYDSSYWGSTNYIFHRGMDRYDPIFAIHAFTLEVYSESIIRQDQLCSLEEYLTKAVDRAVGVISVKSPKSVYSNRSTKRYHYVASCDLSYKQENGRNMVNIGGEYFIHAGGVPLRFNHLKNLLRNAGKNLTLQYDLLFQLKNKLAEGDYRSCVLYAATIFETSLSYKLSEYFRNNNVPEEIQSILLNQIRGFNSFKDFMKKGIIAKYDIRGVDEIAQLRNRVIHEGKIVSKEEAQMSYDTAILFLQFYSWSIFE